MQLSPQTQRSPVLTIGLPRPRRRGALTRSLAAALAGLSLAQIVNAADITWVGAPATPLNFGTGANWAGGAVPDAPDDAVINNGGIATVSAAFTRNITDLRLGAIPGGSGAFTQSGGTINASGNVAFGENTTGVGTLNMSGGQLNVGAGFLGNFSIGDDGGGTATISGGVINAPFAFLGRSTNGHGHVTQTGGTLAVTANLVMAELKPGGVGPQTPSDYTMSGGTITVGNEMYIGAHGPVTMNMSGNSFVSVVGTVHIAASGGQSDPPAGVGTLNMSGGTINVTGANAFFVVADHGNGTFNFSGGVVTTKFYNIGQNFELGFPTIGIVNHTGGVVTANSWTVGEESRSANVYDLSGGTVSVVGLDIFDPGNAYIGAGPGGKGTVKIRGTGVGQVANNLSLGVAGLAGGTLEVSGGTIEIGTNGSGTGKLLMGDLGSGTLIISGGHVSADLVTFGQNAGALGTGTQTGGTFIVRSDFAVGEVSTGANIFDISGGALSIGTGPTGGGIFVGSTGNGTFRLGGTGHVTAVGQITNTSGGTVAVNGGSLTTGGLTNAGIYTQSSGAASLAVVEGAGQMSVTGGTVAATSVNQGTLALSDSGKVSVSPNPATINSFSNLSITGSAAIDVNDGGLIVDYPAATPLPAITANIVSGYAGGAWNGPGINSSAAAVTPRTGLGYGEAAELGIGSFGGVAVDTTALVVRYTLQGDANIDRIVDIGDFALLAANFNTAGGWTRGDFNYDAQTDIGDFALLAANFNQSLAATLHRSDVPEPTAAAIAVVGLLLRRRTQTVSHRP